MVGNGNWRHRINLSKNGRHFWNFLLYRHFELGLNILKILIEYSLKQCFL